jgi:hypothetical protein
MYIGVIIYTNIYTYVNKNLIDILTRLWPFLSRREGGLSLTIDELSQSSCDRRRTSHDAPAGNAHNGVSALCATVFRPGLAARATLALGGDSHPWCASRVGRLAGDGLGDRTLLHQRPSGVEPGHWVGSPGQSNAVGMAHHVAGAPQGGRSSSGLTRPWNAARDGRSRRRVVTGMQYGPRISTSSTVAV